MIPARHTWKGRMICRFFSGFRLDRIFSDIHWIGPTHNPEGSVLMIANHFSWWDGFIQSRLNDKIYHRSFHVMMSEEQLLQNRVLNEIGAFSVRKHSRGILESLQYASSLLKDENNMVLIFPQGRIESNHRSQLHFERGVEYLFKRLPEKSMLLFNVNLVDFHAAQKPALYIYYQLVSPQEIVPPETIEIKYNKFYRECKIQQQNIWI